MQNLQIRLDWLRGSFPAGDVPAMVGLLAGFFGEPAEMARGFWGYKSGIDFDGAKLLCSLPDPVLSVVGLPHATIEIPGKALARLGADVHDLVLALRNFEFNARRIDIAVDDFDKSITPSQVHQRYGSSFQFGPMRYVNFVQGGTRGSPGEGVYFGRRGSQGNGLQLVCYDKSAESMGEVDSIRWEARFSDAKAEQVWSSMIGVKDPDGDWCGEPVDYAAMMRQLGAYVGGSIQFWEDVDRSIPAPFWERIRACLRRGSRRGGSS